ncbi:hypothetical protein ACIN8IBEIGE_50229 [Acinetobacter sp. 8I-beige]|nr:hypothetical protein ACIN8IBEIGE_50229 [Acinetobacter sp. 8I-beige]
MLCTDWKNSYKTLFYILFPIIPMLAQKAHSFILQLNLTATINTTALYR